MVQGIEERWDREEGTEDWEGGRDWRRRSGSRRGGRLTLCDCSAMGWDGMLAVIQTLQ